MALGDGKHLPKTVRVPGHDRMRLMHILPRALHENQWGQWGHQGAGSVSGVPTQEPPVGTVGTQDEIAAARPHCPHTTSNGGDSEKLKENNDVPSDPTVPTDSDAEHTGETHPAGNGAAEPALTCGHCGAEFIRKPGPGRRPKYCSRECRRAALAARTKGYDPDESGDVVFDA
jgi:hypothetical protein